MAASSVSTIEIIDRFQTLLHLESTTYRFDDYLSPSSSHLKNSTSQEMRRWNAKLYGWMYHVVDQHSLNRELVYTGMSYVHRYLSKHPHVNHSETYQLVGMTSLYMAIKIYRNHGKCASINSFVKLSQGLFTEDDFTTMEQSILDTLEWRMHPPTPQSYLDLFMLFLPRSACSPSDRRTLFERIKFLLELSVTVDFFFGKKPSSIAVSAFIEVMDHEHEPNVSKSCRDHFRYCTRSIAGIYCDSQEVVECRDAMRVVHRNAWNQINRFEAMDENQCASPVANKKPTPAVTP